MKIIKEGKIPPEIKYRINCNNCSTLFEFVEHDIIYTLYFYNRIWIYVNCPLCKMQHNGDKFHLKYKG